MCIICIKNGGVDFPSKELHAYNWRQNPHGAGIAVITPDGIFYWKGLMTLQALLDTEANLKKRWGKEYRYIYHYRIQTAGGTVPHLTHPFPITDSFKEMHKLAGKTDALFFHNGIISGYNDPDGKESDTTLFGKYHLYPLLKENPDFFQKEKNRDLMGGIIGSRLCVCLGEKVFMIGDGWIKQGDYWFSHNCGFYNPLPKKTYAPKPYAPLFPTQPGGRSTYSGKKSKKKTMTKKHANVPPKPREPETVPRGVKSPEEIKREWDQYFHDSAEWKKEYGENGTYWEEGGFNYNAWNKYDGGDWID